MNLKAFFLPITAALLLCGCENVNGSAPLTEDISENETIIETIADTVADTVADTAADAIADTADPSAADTRAADPEDSPEAISERVTVTFAPAETESAKTKKTTAQTKETTEAREPLEENQIEYTCKDFSVLMEFNGAESQQYYPRTTSGWAYDIKNYILHSKFTVTNTSERCFDFYASKMYLYGRHKQSSGYMMPGTSDDAGLVSADVVYAVEPGETVSFYIDFAGDEICIDHADKFLCKAIKYTSHEKHGSSTDDYNSGSKATEFEISKRSALKKAVSAARNSEAADTPEPLTPMEGEYSVLTHKNSYCFTAEPICDGRYLRIKLRVQCLTGEPQIFRPHGFYLYTTDGKKHRPHGWSFDKMLTTKEPEVITDMEGINGTVYNTPWELGVRPDGTAEYTMYFYSDDYYKFSYDTSEMGDHKVSENTQDDFECIINIE